ncbi:MAG: FixH family protein [Phycisphaerales bacterium]|nr:FixH family protein [Phycisphaerales bacterium]
MSRSAIWPTFILAIIGLSLATMGTMIYRAVGDPSFAYEPQYYQKALAWDQTAAQRRRNAELAWTTILRTSAPNPATAERLLHLTVADAAGAPIAGAAVTAEVFPSLRAWDRRSLAFRPDPAGGYAADLRADLGGIWRIRLRIERGPEVFTAEFDHTIDAHPGAEASD